MTSPSEFERKANRRTLLDSWRFYDPKGPITGDKSIPGISSPGSGSDYQVCPYKKRSDKFFGNFKSQIHDQTV